MTELRNEIDNYSWPGRSDSRRPEIVPDPKSKEMAYKMSEEVMMKIVTDHGFPVAHLFLQVANEVYQREKAKELDRLLGQKKDLDSKIDSLNHY